MQGVQSLSVTEQCKLCLRISSYLWMLYFQFHSCLSSSSSLCISIKCSSRRSGASWVLSIWTPCAVEMHSPRIVCGVNPSIRLSVILPLPIRRTHRSQMISSESEAKSVGPERERMRGTVCQVSISYLFTPNHPSMSDSPHIAPISLLSFLPLFLSPLLILLSRHHPIPHYQSWPNADLNPLTSRLHYPLQPFLHTHQRKRGSSPLSQTPKAPSSNPPEI